MEEIIIHSLDFEKGAELLYQNKIKLTLESFPAQKLERILTELNKGKEND